MPGFGILLSLRQRCCLPTQSFQQDAHGTRLAFSLGMTQTDKLLYTAKVHTGSGREGASRSDDGRLDVKLATPGTPGAGTNPEQLFAAGWSACFLGAIRLAAAQTRVTLAADVAIDAEVDLSAADGEYFLKARLNVSLPGLERAVAQELMNAAHQTCPYSKATRGNIAVSLNVIEG